MHDAVVIGAGHNGLVAANVLADAGWSVIVYEAEEEPGGAVRSGELIEPGFIHDRYSAFYPLGAASPVFRRLGLEIPWRHGPLVLAHPATDGSVAVLSRDPGVTTMGPAWPSMLETWARIEPAILLGLITPFPQVRAGLYARARALRRSPPACTPGSSRTPARRRKHACTPTRHPRRSPAARSVCC